MTVMVMSEEPDWLVAGVMVTVLLAPVPLKTMLGLGTKVRLLLVPETVTPARVSISLTVKLMTFGVLMLVL